MTNLVRATYLIGEDFRKQDFVGETADKDFLAWLEETARKESQFKYLGSERLESVVCWKYNEHGQVEVWDGLLPVGNADMTIKNDKDITWFFEDYLGLPLGEVHVNDWDVCENPGSWFKKDYGVLDDYISTLDDEESKAPEEFDEVEEDLKPVEENQPMSAFEHWFRTFIEEKDLPVVGWEIEWKDNIHLIDNYDMVEIICELPAEQQSKIKDKLVGIDFLNGDVNHFLKYLAEGYIATMF
jgi:hypothetical protein